ncbi:MAG: UDP-N-acetylmuramoyl-tripeptide--D-alanyl-D-alanine ligase [Chitinophagia bacterium]|jgi:UDP-N-acetylmuramoyl-tripeptide--D-alanyl-D-alanine ligase|nr:UDP-N-acetylmuramoyl-tripeptide--D-alanyl-D-alanine ligase [Chitinophagia bacterium]NCA29728.1 UDP-N-acetylmuramoyl-tripeptide--D-alanyl-D-alanine ligase [Chitinophagia bacterium]NDD16395.1 UDP-N-acetylmuramoyl-tripeptide--D-alanyl-D-alanine ligase [Chitinophagia bacterium]
MKQSSTPNAPLSISDLYELYKSFSQIQTDTRQLKKGDLYFALKGPNFNGNEFALVALEQGAAYAIVDEPVTVNEQLKDRIIYVKDVLSSLQALAKFHREQFNIPFIAITGSNGKTTTKELVAAVLNSHYKTYTTKGNLNNHIGVPLTLLSIQKDAEFAIIEMGANHLKEIESYCSYTLPTHGLINNCGKAHLEGFGGEEGVRKGKGELYDYLKTHNGIAFINSDLDYLVKMSQGIGTIISYGIHSGQLQGETLEAVNGHTTNNFLELKITKCSNAALVNKVIKSQLVGNYNLPNVLAAISIGLTFEVPVVKIIAAIENYTPTNSRSQLIEWKNNKVILDAYNANPSSMQLAIENFAKIKNVKKILCIGGMRELGKESQAEHQALLEQIKTAHFEKVILVGKEFEKCQHSFTYFENSALAKSWLDQEKITDHFFLIKGSRGIQMEKIIALD